MKQIINTVAMLLLLIFTACGSKKSNDAPEKTNKTNYLTMKINGKVWTADNGIFGAFHPNGYNNAIIISGNLGQGATQQSFTINMYNTTGPATYAFANMPTGVDRNVAQLGGVSAQNYLYGGLPGIYNITVTVSKATKTPSLVEATFEGTLTGVKGDVLTITEGKFYYQE